MATATREVTLTTEQAREAFDATIEQTLGDLKRVAEALQDSFEAQLQPYETTHADARDTVNQLRRSLDLIDALGWPDQAAGILTSEDRVRAAEAAE